MRPNRRPTGKPGAGSRPAPPSPAAGARVILLLSLLSSLALTTTVAAEPKRIYIANDDHTDYVWSGDEAQYRAAFISMLDYYMTQAENTANNPPDSRGRFNCDGNLWIWEYEHNKSAAQFQRLVGHLQAGTITMPLNAAALCFGGSPAEAVFRGMYYAGRLERRYNVRFPLVVAMENQTLPGGVASLWAGSGALYSWRGVCGCLTQTNWGNRPREVYHFRGPDGQGVCLKWNTMRLGNQALGGYAEARTPSNVVNYLDTDATYTSSWPWSVSAAFGYGWDDLQTTTGSFVTTSQSQSNANRRVIVSNEVDFFEDFLAVYGNQIPVFSGSFGNEWELLQSSMGAVTAEFRGRIEKLRTAEALATIASLVNPNFMTGREAARDLAGMAAGLFYEHDWTADGPVSPSVRAQFQRSMLTNLKNYVDPLQTDALATVAAAVRMTPGVERHLVFNPLSWSRTDFADLKVAMSPPLRVVDMSTGAEVPSQVMSTSPTVVRVLASNVPSVGYQVYEVRAGAGAAFPPSASVAQGTLDNGVYAVTLGGWGDLTSVIDHRDGDRQLVNVAGGGAICELASGTGTVVVESSGPVSTTLNVVAGGSPAHEARVTLYAGIDRIDFDGRVTQNFSSTVTYTSKFNLPGSTMRHEEVGMIAKVARAAQGGDYADANARTDYLSFGHFVDLSDATRGVTVSNWDSPYFQAGNSTTTTLDATTPSIKAVVGMQVNGAGHGIPNQGGDTWFQNRFAFRTHGAYDPAAAMRFSLEHQNPLTSARLTGGEAGSLPSSSYSLVSLPSPDILLWALKPSEEGIGQGVIARVWNLAEGTRSLQLALMPGGLASARNVTHIETDLGPATVGGGTLTDGLARQQMKTYRLFAASSSLAVIPGGADSPGTLAATVFPNPSPRGQFSTISFVLRSEARARVTVKDVRGAAVATILDERRAAGRQSAVWDQRTRRELHARPGVYYVVVEALGETAVSPVVVLE